ncbi:MAG: thioredoxin family protein [Bacteroidia bacterium]|nr:thioredoxin family protein [Bacteroidia bacterium]
MKTTLIITGIVITVLGALSILARSRMKNIPMVTDHKNILTLTEIASRYNIQSVPTLMIFKNGEIKYKQAGVHTKPQLMNVLLNNL